jgi:hypothetical protein
MGFVANNLVHPQDDIKLGQIESCDSKQPLEWNDALILTELNLEECRICLGSII